ncbi:S1/P1 nuclease [Novosphingobium gossypii]|uniref:S1/P1 nuclease n=1 Tax=Novosphingobium gossypii TaxID=1604774 RepID=UPI003D23DBB3
MRFVTAAVLGAAIVISSPTLAWGPVGHRITGAIAQDALSGVARAKVEILLGHEDLAEAATWPDDMRSDPSAFWQKTSPPWHYVTVAGDDYVPSDEPGEGDALTALTRFTATLRDPKASIDDQRMALRFVVHIIGDLHQPLHVGTGTDKGGNAVKVTWFGKPTNLHTVWDSSLIEQRALSYSEYAQWLERSTTPEQVLQWNERDPRVWMHESIVMRRTAYPADPALSYDYVYRHRDDIDTRLKMAGIRIAAYLNRVLEPPQGEGEPAKRK